jgi:two-component system chemotaxis response regulator CheY
VAQADELRRQQVLQRRFQGMGLDASLLPGGRALLVTLPVGPEPFETPQGPRTLRAVRFYTVGHDRIKCLAPRALFHLPLLRVVDCEDPGTIERRIRRAWAVRLQDLERTRAWLEGLGVAIDAPLGAPQWSFGLGLEDERARGVAIEVERVVLPSRGPLSGLPLARAEDRVFRTEGSCQSAVDLELAITSRLEALARTGRRPVARRRPAADDLPAPRSLRRVPVLLVGPRLAADRALREALRLHGFDVGTSRALADAVGAFRDRTYEVVLAEARLDRGDGLELIPALRTLPGILELPVALVDDRSREGRRATAEAAGAAAYWSGPFDAERFAEDLGRLAGADRRRFVRFARALSVTWPGCSDPAVTATIGRGGMFVSTPAAPNARERYALHLPETRTTLRIDAEPVYRLPPRGLGPEGMGLRFCGFEPGAERDWIDYLGGLVPATPPSAPTGV